MGVCVWRDVPAGSQEGIDLEAAEAEKQAKEKAAAEKRYQSLEELFIKELGITEDYLAEARAAEEAALKTVRLCSTHSQLLLLSLLLTCQPILYHQGDTVDLDDLHVDLAATGTM